MTEPSGPDLAAYLAGELDSNETRAVEAQLARDPAARERVDGLEKSFALLDYLPAPTPAADFAAKTLTLIAASHDAVTLPASRPIPVRRSRRRPRLLAAAALALALGAGIGAAARRVGPAVAAAEVAADPAADLAADYRVSVRLPWYLGCDDLAFARVLAGPGLFPPDEAAPLPALAPTAGEPADRLIALFESLPERRRGQLRRLDAEFAALPGRERGDLARTLDAYAGWLDALPSDDRRRVFGADAASRAAVVRELRGRSPARAPWPTARLRALAAPGRIWPFTDPELSAQVEAYARDVFKVDLAGKLDSAAGRLSREEFADLRGRRDAATRDGLWGGYGLQFARLAERHPSLPEPVGGPPLTDRAGLPPEFVRAARAHQLLLRVDAGSRGRWPEFALELAAEARKVGVKVPESFGPCRPAQLAPAVRAVLAKFSPEERAALVWLEGRWPDYPREFLRVAAARDLSVPGVTLPGAPSQWAATYRVAP